MGTFTKGMFCFIMLLALLFGFFEVYLPLERYSYERLHIFLFNLCTGGTILLYYTQGNKKMGVLTQVFFISALLYTMSAFLEIYPLTLAVTPFLIATTERIRTKEFGFWPTLFFKSGTTVSRKFHLSSLLCLSIALIMAAGAIINSEYTHWINLEKFTLNTFFLGFSFPLSLLSLHLVFAMLLEKRVPLARLAMEICFWSITLGVVIFFVFILMENLFLQLIISMALFAAVFMIFCFYVRHADPMQEKLFLTSGIAFLIFTAITGIGYIFLEMSPGYDPMQTRWLLQMHVFTSLYGWNLSGLAVACRFYDFPIAMNSPRIIGMHWITLILLAPLGIRYPEAAFLTLGVYGFIIINLFFSKNAKLLRKEVLYDQ